MAFKDVFTPLFILIACIIFIGGILILQFIHKIFAGSNNLMAVQIFFIAIIINIIILLFLIMSFSKIKFEVGPIGPQGNKGERGFDGASGGINTCDIKVINANDKKMFENSKNYLDLKPPLIIDE